jgi:NADPH:quinone reductase-like Zn-dependent oxidoreductase
VKQQLPGGDSRQRQRGGGGVIEGARLSVGEEVTLFAPGDEVWYAGALGRAGSNSEYQLVDRGVSPWKPARTLVSTGLTETAFTATSRSRPWAEGGVVQSVGEEVTLFAPGDEVWYAGALGRAGSNSEYPSPAPAACRPGSRRALWCPPD